MSIPVPNEAPMPKPEITYCPECGHECYPGDPDMDDGACPNCGWEPEEKP